MKANNAEGKTCFPHTLPVSVLIQNIYKSQHSERCQVPYARYDATWYMRYLCSNREFFTADLKLVPDIPLRHGISNTTFWSPILLDFHLSYPNAISNKKLKMSIVQNWTQDFDRRLVSKFDRTHPTEYFNLIKGLASWNFKLCRNWKVSHLVHLTKEIWYDSSRVILRGIVCTARVTTNKMCKSTLRLTLFCEICRLTNGFCWPRVEKGNHMCTDFVQYIHTS